MRWKRGTSRTLGAAGPEAELEESGAEITLVYSWGNGKKQGQLYQEGRSEPAARAWPTGLIYLDSRVKNNRFVSRDG